MSNNTDVHTRHCCKVCGCKYGEDTPDWDGFISCSVVSGHMKQEAPCGKTSVCWDRGEDFHSEVCKLNAEDDW